VHLHSDVIGVASSAGSVFGHWGRTIQGSQSTLFDLIGTQGQL